MYLLLITYSGTSGYEFNSLNDFAQISIKMDNSKQKRDNGKTINAANMHMKLFLIEFKDSGMAIAPVTWQQNREAHIKKKRIG